MNITKAVVIAGLVMLLLLIAWMIAQGAMRTPPPKAELRICCYLDSQYQGRCYMRPLPVKRFMCWDEA